jgi:hypothetical protein
MCVDGALSLRILQEFLMRKMKQVRAKLTLLFEIGGRVRNPSDSIGVLSER